jgi:radical SAM superfamily enzyme YgiQ (UPF0313 family)
MKVLLLTPPLVQLNTPYPATTYLTGYLRSRGYVVTQADPGLTWVLRLLSPDGLARLRSAMPTSTKPASASVTHFHRAQEQIAAVMPAALQLLQGRDATLCHRIAGRRMLPEGPRFAALGPEGQEEQYLAWAFGHMGIADKARYLATLFIFIEDVADAIQAGIDPHFQFARYGESLAASVPTLDPLLDELRVERVTARILAEVTRELYERERPDVVGMSVPFPGNVLGALRIAQTLRQIAPAVRIAWGGGYINTELRELTDARLFDFVDAVTYDDGERPLELLLERWAGRGDKLLRTRLRQDGAVELVTSGEADVPLRAAGRPTTDGLPLGDYLSLIDMLNPMHRLWSDTRWNKLTVAHGCYWKKCTFCDLSLDYIANYEPLAAGALVDRIEALIAENGGRGFHFVDEAAPPAGLKALAEELLRRQVQIAWWGNIRFEKTFTPELCALLARSGCIAVSGGLEVASDRLLARMQKGVTVEQVARVTRAFGDTGIRVHAYLMYGFPTQTVGETIDSLEYVRQLFAAGCIDSGFWHRFSATAHAPIGQRPREFGIELVPSPDSTFARNDLEFVDPTGVDHDRLGVGLQKALYNYMLGLGIEEDARSWFDIKVPKTTVPHDFIQRALAGPRRAKVRRRT